MVNKRILFINNSSSLGIGTSTILLLLLKYFHNEFDCAVVSDKHSVQLPETLKKLPIRHYALPDRFIFYLPSLVNLILRGKYDLVYANGSNERSRGRVLGSKNNPAATDLAYSRIFTKQEICVYDPFCRSGNCQFE